MQHSRAVRFHTIPSLVFLTLLFHTIPLNSPFAYIKQDSTACKTKNFNKKILHTLKNLEHAGVACRLHEQKKQIA